MAENKQIIIDGVDVSGCKLFRNGICASPINPKCKLCVEISEKMCYYKQLKRKEQEYEELRQHHNKCCEEFENEKQKLIDKYNQFSKDFFIGKYCKKEYCDLLKAKEQECEELKNEIEACYNQVEDFDIIATSKSNKLKQAEQKLKRIKQVCEDYCEQMCLCDSRETCKDCINTEILQIIDEVE